MAMDRRIWMHFDFLLFVFLMPLFIISSWLIFEANTTLSLKQGFYYALSFVLFWIVFLIPFRKLDRLFFVFYWGCIILLILVDIVGSSKLGAKRWLSIPFTSITIQPSEPVKIAILLLLAHLIKLNPPPSKGYDWGMFLKLSFYILLPTLLILKEPDLGTALIIAIMGFGILLLVGLRMRVWLPLAITLAIASPIAYHFLHDYQKKRIADFISEKPNYHVKQSQIAIGSGGLFGKAKEDSTQTKFKFLPIATSDFIFAYYVERFGFVGALLLFAIYISLTLHLFSYIFDPNSDWFLQVVALGISILIFTYSSVNIAMTLGLAPVVGIPLPLFSYGGSSFITFIIMFAILENLLAFRYVFGYNSKSSFNKFGFLAQLVRALGS
ncbi:FtsW/RodA/SpoVE family cell cycle protein [Helicobacter cetorum]|uniref:Cell wall polymerase n=1 Tax=Helicobacter cetorum (strain ATCC BAA-429 / MIT 00-7128) TaxID=182217 RepID=I0EMQ3_HELC0|nr:FtsW/RodA/SpoVE family cell cycle protein [Helicobacter cetorum]AFI04222.1 rod shape-determining protein RodA [Helicobacter cetorum MIT 00-7128]